MLTWIALTYTVAPARIWGAERSSVSPPEIGPRHHQDGRQWICSRGYRAARRYYSLTDSGRAEKASRREGGSQKIAGCSEARQADEAKLRHLLQLRTRLPRVPALL